jgi:hypothetical protein
LSVNPRPRLRAALRLSFGFVSVVPSVAPRAPLSRSEAPRRRVGRAPRAGAQNHAERDVCGRLAGVLGALAPRALGESAAAFTRRSSLGVWRRFVRPVRRPARAAPSLRGPAPAVGARTTSGRADAHQHKACGLPSHRPAYRTRRALRAPARPLVVCALPAGAGPRSERAACAGRRTGRPKRRQTPNEARRANAAATSPRARGARTPSSDR